MAIVGYQEDRIWADRFHSQVQHTLEDLLPDISEFTVAPFEDDVNKGIDYVFKIGNRELKLACRIYRVTNAEFDDVTLRAWRSSGVETEITKIQERHVDWYMFGWSDKTYSYLEDWILVDVKRLVDSKIHLNRELVLNNDGRTAFIVIPTRELREIGCIIGYGTFNLKKAELWRTNIASFHSALMYQRTNEEIGEAMRNDYSTTKKEVA